MASSTAARGPGEGSDTIEAIQLRLRKRATWLVGRGPVTTCGVRTQDIGSFKANKYRAFQVPSDMKLVGCGRLWDGALTHI